MQTLAYYHICELGKEENTWYVDFFQSIGYVLNNDKTIKTKYNNHHQINLLHHCQYRCYSGVWWSDFRTVCNKTFVDLT